MGHASIRTTSDTYGHLFKDAKTDIADALEATFLDGLPETETDERRTKFGSTPLRRVH